MTPTLWGKRLAFSCLACGRTSVHELEFANGESPLQCEHCSAWQAAPTNGEPIPADRIVIARSPQRIMKRGALAAIDHPVFGLSIKRIVAIPGDVIAFEGETVVVNGKPVPSPNRSNHLQQPAAATAPASIDAGRGNERNWRLESGEYFVLGDNRAVSIDSRNPRFGLVRSDQIRGLVVEIRPAIPAGPLADAKRSRSAAK